MCVENVLLSQGDRKFKQIIEADGIICYVQFFLSH